MGCTEWKCFYEVTSEDSDKQEDIMARREVNKFMQGRMKAILLDGFTVPGITAQYAANKLLTYHKEGGYYE